MWKITAYNGTEWKAPNMMTIYGAIELFMKETGLHEMDIKAIENLH